MADPKDDNVMSFFSGRPVAPRDVLPQKPRAATADEELALFNDLTAFLISRKGNLTRMQIVGICDALKDFAKYNA
ncbi:hypothetical protein [Methylobacterium sp. 1030]|uniref:hypothetical protein n=1 Tax=Methylobacterium sp. 1030 TaxID=3156404 RepID=UPI00339561E7